MLKIKKVDFHISFADYKQIPDLKLPELAFVGRSNVGKSSLINDLSSKKVSFTSQTPGKTRLINYFLVNEKFYFVDLPGYGYAKVSKSQKNLWEEHIEKYLETSNNLKTIFFLLDIRRIPNEQDKILSNWFKKLPDVEVFYILTKSDKFSKQQRQKQKIQIALELFVDQSKFIFYSVPEKIGKAEILKQLDFLEN
ncbi:MAG: hypothetical protein A2086_00260 [Spirochaetes bacterium GWD1_27_9]|nr:MAG: hypothetical protein A2Z98_09395 [Spirochaetes bacterium GWB1_27_13]OHD26859.1 MAG: hypothetical protein A2Y34_13585 [Spirochaetes bacterium GWC1_27_15]OHD43004.1 MAG: hypothetical protein A2086_00260 [Spirochaetes bacterium GWD1_27_9]